MSKNFGGPGKLELPTTHVAGMRVPKGGSSCAKCKYLRDPKHCGNGHWQKWSGTDELPVPADEYCCDWFEAKLKKAYEHLFAAGPSDNLGTFVLPSRKSMKAVKDLKPGDIVVVLQSDHTKKEMTVSSVEPGAGTTYNVKFTDGTKLNWSSWDKVNVKSLRKSKDDLPDAPRGKKRPTYVAIDFDNTICQHTEDHDDFDKPPIHGAREFIQKLRDRGYRTIIWTVRGDDEKVTAWLKDNDVPYDYVNYNPDQPKGGSNKLKADAYVDDKAVLANGDWAAMLDEVEDRLKITERNTKCSHRHPRVVNVVGRSKRKSVNKVKPTRHIDEENRVVTYVLTTGDTDRDDETVDPTGGVFDDYMMNPAVSFNHDTDSLTIGSMLRMWNDEVGEGTKYPEIVGPKRMALLGDVYFSKEDDFSDTCYRKVIEQPSTLGGGSISFLPVEGYTEQGPKGNHYTKWKLLEFAVCPVGSNPSAVALGRRLKRLKRKAQQRRWDIYANGKFLFSTWAESYQTAIEFARSMVNDPSVKLTARGPHSGDKKMKRRVWINKTLKYAWVLKSEGDVDAETQQYVSERGLQGVKTEDGPPPDDSGYVEDKGFAGIVDQDQDGKWWIVDSGGHKLKGPWDSEFAAQNALANLQGKSIPKGETEEVADDVARRAKEMADVGVSVDAATDAAMKELEVPKAMRKAVKQIAKKRLVQKKKKKRKFIVKVDGKGYKAREGFVGSPADAERMSRKDAVATVGQLTADGMTPELYKRRKAKYVVKGSQGYVAKDGYVNEPGGAVRMTKKEAKQYVADKGIDDPGMTPILYKDLKAPTEDVANWEGATGGGNEGMTTEWQRIDDDVLTGWQMKSKELVPGSGPGSATQVPPGGDDDLYKRKRKALSDDIDPAKACQILSDGKVDGKPLTEAQRGMFGAACAKARKWLRRGRRKKLALSAAEMGSLAAAVSKGFKAFRCCKACKGKESLCPNCVEVLRKGMKKADALEGANAQWAQSPMKPGFKTLAKLLKVIQNDATDVDHPVVLSTLEKAVQTLESTMRKVYGDKAWQDWTDQQGDWNVYSKNPDNDIDKGLDVQEMDDGTWCVYDSDADDWVDVEGVDSWPTEEEARNAVNQATVKSRSKNSASIWAKCKSFVRRRVLKRGFTKAHANVIKAAVDFLDDAAGAADTPKRLAYGMKALSAELKSISDEKPQQLCPQAELKDADAEKLEAAVKRFEDKASGVARTFFRASGQQI